MAVVSTDLMIIERSGVLYKTPVSALPPDAAILINARTTTSYTLVLADAGKKITSSNAATQLVTIPTNASVAFPVGTVLGVTQIGAGVLSVKGATGVTVNGLSAGTVAIIARWTGITLTKLATDTWLAEGNVGAAT